MRRRSLSQSLKDKAADALTPLAETATDARGTVLVGGLETYTPVTVGIDETSLSDPMLVPRQALQVVVPRPGVPADVEAGGVRPAGWSGAVPDPYEEDRPWCTSASTSTPGSPSNP